MEPFLSSENAALFSRLPAPGAATKLGKLQTWIADTVRSNLADPVYQEYCLPILEEERPYHGSCFLSVVMRTQGRRPETLREALASLQAQTDQNFEVILVAHKPSDEQMTLVSGIADSFAPDFRQKIRLYRLEHGHRSMPLNIGFAHARGRYIAILDDDDLALPCWVEKFRAAAETAGGTILHAYPQSQPWKAESAGGKNMLMPAGEPDDFFCKPFRMLAQLQINSCPPMGLAFPRMAFADYGFLFDDTLNTTEDWDFLMRTAFFFDVTDIPEITCIYREWVNQENSKTLHSPTEWQANSAAIQEKFASGMLILDGPALSALIHPQVPPTAGQKAKAALSAVPRQLQILADDVRKDGPKAAAARLGKKISTVGKLLRK